MEPRLIIRDQPPKGYARARPLTEQFRIAKKTDFEMLMDVVYRHAPHLASTIINGANYNQRAARRAMLGEAFEALHNNNNNEAFISSPLNFSVTSTTSRGASAEENFDEHKDALRSRIITFNLNDDSPLDLRITEENKAKEATDVKEKTCSCQNNKEVQTETDEDAKRAFSGTSSIIMLPNKQSLLRIQNNYKTSSLNDPIRNCPSFVPPTTVTHIISNNNNSTQPDIAVINKDLNGGEILFQNIYIINNNNDNSKQFGESQILIPPNASSANAPKPESDSQSINKIVEKQSIVASSKRSDDECMKNQGKTINEIIDDINRKERLKRQQLRKRRRLNVELRRRRRMSSLLSIGFGQQQLFKPKRRRLMTGTSVSCQTAIISDEESDGDSKLLDTSSEQGLRSAAFTDGDAFNKAPPEREKSKEMDLLNDEYDGSEELIEILSQDLVVPLEKLPAGEGTMGPREDDSSNTPLTDIQLTVLKHALDDNDDDNNNNNNKDNMRDMSTNEDNQSTLIADNVDSQEEFCDEKEEQTDVVESNSETTYWKRRNLRFRKNRPKYRTVIRKSPRLSKLAQVSQVSAEDEYSSDETSRNSKRKMLATLVNTRREKARRMILSNEPSPHLENEEEGKKKINYKRKSTSNNNNNRVSVIQKNIQGKLPTETDNRPNDILSSILVSSDNMNAKIARMPPIPKVKITSNLVDNDTFLPKYLKKMQKNPLPNQTPTYQPNYNFPNQITNVTIPIDNKKIRTNPAKPEVVIANKKNRANPAKPEIVIDNRKIRANPDVKPEIAIDNKDIRTNPAKPENVVNNKKVRANPAKPEIVVPADPRQKPAAGVDELLPQGQENIPNLGSSTTHHSKPKDVTACDEKNVVEQGLSESKKKVTKEGMTVYDFSDTPPSPCGSSLRSFRRIKRNSSAVEPSQQSVPACLGGLKIRIVRDNFTHKVELL